MSKCKRCPHRRDCSHRQQPRQMKTPKILTVLAFTVLIIPLSLIGILKAFQYKKQMILLMNKFSSMRRALPK